MSATAAVAVSCSVHTLGQKWEDKAHNLPHDGSVKHVSSFAKSSMTELASNNHSHQASTVGGAEDDCEGTCDSIMKRICGLHNQVGRSSR